jgi:hypothetical protein
MIVFNNLARIVAVSVVLAAALGSAAPTPSPEKAVDNINWPEIGDGLLEVGKSILGIRAEEEEATQLGLPKYVQLKRKEKKRQLI